MTRTFRMVFVSVLENEPDQLRDTVETLGNDLGIDVDFYGIYGEDADEDVLVYHELVRRTEQADYVFFRCMGDINRFHHWDRYEEVLKNIRGYPAVFSGNPEVNIMTRPLFKGNDDEYRELFAYVRDRCPENDRNAVFWVMNRLGFTAKHPDPPVVHRLHGVYHKGMDDDITKDDYIRTLDPKKETIGLVFPSNNWVYGTLDHVDAIVDE
ncbi:MAG: cobaltochelatase subunit CobN, partial [Candidatus Methanomethylophilaceae archaeon]|nr:cobaltochelatase subunit CobN [Candidatus Methanomethylophilaceae archaeon]